MLFRVVSATCTFPEVTALHEVSLEIRSGDRLAILGANGSGKSTLLRLLDGLCLPSSGSVIFDGTPLTPASLADGEFAFGFRRRVGLVFQNPEVQLFNPTVFDEVAFGPLQLDWPREQIIDRVHSILRDLDISHLHDRAPHRLSGGEKKRVALASVLILDPEILLLDEPTDALDPQSQSQILDYLAAMPSSRTVITATHRLDILGEIATHCHVLEDGHLVSSGSPAQILADHTLLHRTRLLHTHRHHHGTAAGHAHPHLLPSHTHSTGGLA